MNPSHDSVELTRALVAFDTINPPGNERPCAKHLGCLLEDGGFSVSYHELAEQQTSLVAHIVGPSDTKPLCFTGHIDTGLCHVNQEKHMSDWRRPSMPAG